MGVTPDEVINKLFINADCVCREGTDERKGDDDWSIEISKGCTLSGWLKNEVKGITGKPDFNLRLQWLTRLAETLRDNPKGEPESGRLDTPKSKIAAQASDRKGCNAEICNYSSHIRSSDQQGEGCG